MLSILVYFLFFHFIKGHTYFYAVSLNAANPFKRGDLALYIIDSKFQVGSFTSIQSCDFKLPISQSIIFLFDHGNQKKNKGKEDVYGSGWFSW